MALKHNHRTKLFRRVTRFVGWRPLPTFIPVTTFYCPSCHVDTPMSLHCPHCDSGKCTLCCTCDLHDEDGAVAVAS